MFMVLDKWVNISRFGSVVSMISYYIDYKDSYTTSLPVYVLYFILY